eukprot:656353-Rhodomonas_salina.1
MLLRFLLVQNFLLSLKAAISALKILCLTLATRAVPALTTLLSQPSLSRAAISALTISALSCRVDSDAAAVLPKVRADIEELETEQEFVTDVVATLLVYARCFTHGWPYPAWGREAA